MLVVPVARDKILTKDDDVVRVVSSYTNLKPEPAVYLAAGSDRRYVELSEIVELNGVRVEFDEDSKTLKTLATLRRKFNLPQPGDTVTVKIYDVPYKPETSDLVVKSLRLHSQKYGISKGLVVVTDDAYFTLDELLDIKHDGWSETYDQAAFERYYLDYYPFKS